jgi:CHAT domain-containing protein
LGTAPNSLDDGLLQVREIRDLPIHAELVTLSACDTGNGRLLGERRYLQSRAGISAGRRQVGGRESLDDRRHIHDRVDETVL